MCLNLILLIVIIIIILVTIIIWLDRLKTEYYLPSSTGVTGSTGSAGSTSSVVNKAPTSTLKIIPKKI